MQRAAHSIAAHRCRSLLHLSACVGAATDDSSTALVIKIVARCKTKCNALQNAINRGVAHFCDVYVHMRQRAARCMSHTMQNIRSTSATRSARVKIMRDKPLAR